VVFLTKEIKIITTRRTLQIKAMIRLLQTGILFPLKPWWIVG